MSRTTVWTVAILTMVAVLIAALVVELRRDSPASSPTANPAGIGREHRDADSESTLVGPRERAHLQPCPTGETGGGQTTLRDVTVECAADGSAVDVARALAGHRVVLNLWAYWCVPCTAELPAMAEYQQRVGPEVMVVTVHQDENETAGLLRLADLGVTLPTLQDGRRRIAAALRVPNVMPATVVLDSDGSVARVLPRAFASADDIAVAVSGQAG